MKKHAKDARNGLPASPRPTEIRNPWELSSHPQQDALFRPVSDGEIDRLAAEMAHGQVDPIEITEDGEIIDGHQRVRAARKAGLTEIRVVVRRDLKGRQEIDRRHIEANRGRRQLDSLDLARLAIRSLEIEKSLPPGGLRSWNGAEVRDRVGRAIGQSGRNARRYLNVLRAPMEVQRAVSEERLALTVAEKVHRLSPEVRTRIVKAIRAGKDPTGAVREHLPARRPRSTDPGSSLGTLVVALQGGMEALSGREGEIVRDLEELSAEIRTLGRFSKFSRGLREALRERRDRMKDERGRLDEFLRSRQSKEGRSDGSARTPGSPAEHRPRVPRGEGHHPGRRPGRDPGLRPGPTPR
ncbi:ParB/RepB/Spo0J family partition protein [Tundrisphaera lichenicola]|uniref:ParB/RepB/Spo0J family partition protein n=1 Tax=Tundrisphaera lichenicola TaxID=2029860 RepID=UPI003EBA4D0C